MLNMSNFAAALKQIYPKGVPTDQTIKKNPLWGMIEKVGDFYGDVLVVPFRYADPASRSRTLSTALAQRTASASSYARVTLKRGHDSAVISIDRETMMASANDAGAFLRARKAEVDGMLNSLGRSIAIAVFGDASGIRGQISTTSGVASAAGFLLSNPNDVTNFEVDQALRLTAARPAFGVAATLRTGVAYIVGVDRDTGLLQVAAAPRGTAVALNTLVAAAAVGDLLLLDGDAVATSSSSNASAIAGLAAWLPLVAPTTGDNFFGLDRSVDVTRLAGIRFVGTGLPIEEALIKCASRVARDGGSPDLVVMSFNQLSNLVTSLGSRVRYDSVKASAKVGYQVISLVGPNGDIKILADQNCPDGVAYMLQMDTWKFHHLGEVPHIAVEGNVSGALQEADADAIQIRAFMFGQLVCDAPGYNAVLTLDV